MYPSPAILSELGKVIRNAAIAQRMTMQNVFRYVGYRTVNAVRALPEQQTGRLATFDGFYQLIQDIAEAVFQFS